MKQPKIDYDEKESLFDIVALFSVCLLDGLGCLSKIKSDAVEFRQQIETSVPWIYRRNANPFNGTIFPRYKFIAFLQLSLRIKEKKKN